MATKPRELATHWVLVGPKGEIAVEKFRPMLRATFPEMTERELNNLTSKVYQAKESGYEHDGILMVRRVVPGIYESAAKSLRTKKQNPFLSEAEFHAKFRGRRCVS
jgi:hypothetical protein